MRSRSGARPPSSSCSPTSADTAATRSAQRFSTRAASVWSWSGSPCTVASSGGLEPHFRVAR